MDDQTFTRRIEIIKLIVTTIISLSVASIAYVVQHSVVAQQSRNVLLSNMSAKLIDRRLHVYDRIKIPLNRIYCFIEKKGDWQSYSPIEIINMHNMLNEVIYSERAIWSPETIRLYTEYMNQQAFLVDSDSGNIKVRAEIRGEDRHTLLMDEPYDKFLTGERSPTHKEAYRNLNDALAKDLIISRDEIILQKHN
ncbi:TPA: hypothetical protein ACH0TZ_003174 [Citrobacter werkmanii]